MKHFWESPSEDTPTVFEAWQARTGVQCDEYNFTDVWSKYR